MKDIVNYLIAYPSGPKTVASLFMYMKDNHPDQLEEFYKTIKVNSLVKPFTHEPPSLSLSQAICSKECKVKVETILFTYRDTSDIVVRHFEQIRVPLPVSEQYRILLESISYHM